MSPVAHGDLINAEWLLEGSPTGFRQANMKRLDVAADLAALTTQIMTSVAVPLQAGQTVSNISFLSGATAAGTPTNWWYALYSLAATPALLAQTADQTSGAWAADTVKTLALQTAQLITVTGIYFVAIMMKATTVVTLMGKSVNRAAAAGAVVTGQPILAQTSGAALTTTAPATIATPTTVATVPYVVLT